MHIKIWLVSSNSIIVSGLTKILRVYTPAMACGRVLVQIP